ncbi:MAG: response regulator transcription factor [Pseudohongiellaceae bacterium]
MTQERMLLVEDDEVFAHVICRAMRQRGYQIVHAASLPAATQCMETEVFDHAILDLNLSGHSSLPLIPLLKQLNPAMQILVLTGYASIATAVEAIKLGANNYLSKPADADEILAALVQDSEGGTENSASIQEPMSVRRLEWEHIQKVLKENDGNISETARQLKMHRRTLQRKLQKKPVAR